MVRITGTVLRPETSLTRLVTLTVAPSANDEADAAAVADIVGYPDGRVRERAFGVKV